VTAPRRAPAGEAAHRSRVEPPGAGWLTPLADHWISAALEALAHRPALVRVTQVSLRGSGPREPGASMLVHDTGAAGTIGGGHLEWHATAIARQLMEPAAGAVCIVELNLGPDLGQCCGGRVELWLERLTGRDIPWLNEAARRLRERRAFCIASEFAGGVVRHRLLPESSCAAGLELRRESPDRFTLVERPTLRSPVWIFGAGHVGQMLVRLLSGLGLFEITWIDSRPDVLPAELPGGVIARLSAAPAALVADAPPGTRFVVMTHDHALDYEVCRRVLLRRDASWLGLIGSASKSARFRSRLLREGIDRESLACLTSPIGVPGITSKVPAAIAIAISAQLLQQAVPARPGAAENTPACSGRCGACAPDREKQGDPDA
jgi:xanthine dehydrogenase accessory factor